MGAVASDPLQTALGSWRSWPLALHAPPEPVAVVPGGRTNRNVRLKAPGLDHDLLLRLNHPQSKRLGIDRQVELEIMRLAADAGFGRPCLYADPDHRFAVFPWLDARAWTQDDYDDPAQRRRLLPRLEELQSLEVTRPRRRYHDYLCTYRDQLIAHNAFDSALQAAWQAFESELIAFDRADWTAQWVHHDLTPANVLDCGDRLVLIDWEYAAVGHPDIDRWSIDSAAPIDPLVVELMGWVNRLWERLLRARIDVSDASGSHGAGSA